MMPGCHKLPYATRRQRRVPQSKALGPLRPGEGRRNVFANAIGLRRLSLNAFINAKVPLSGIAGELKAQESVSGILRSATPKAIESWA